MGSTGTITCKATSSAVLAAGKAWVVTFTVEQPAKAVARQVSETSTVRAANPDPLTKNNTARLTSAV